jgi:hypothetical protein
LAGLDPALHVFFPGGVADQDVDPRVKPGGGEIKSETVTRERA